MTIDGPASEKKACHMICDVFQSNTNRIETSVKVIAGTCLVFFVRTTGVVEGRSVVFCGHVCEKLYFYLKKKRSRTLKSGNIYESCGGRDRMDSAVTQNRDNFTLL